MFLSFERFKEKERTNKKAAFSLIDQSGVAIRYQS